MKADLKCLTSTEMEIWAKEMGLDPYRGRQIRQWLFKRLTVSFDEMTNLSRSHREILKERARIDHLEVVKTQTSEDRTTKFLFKLADGLSIESVLIPEQDHFTICISSQAGCAMGCRFCLTAKQGLKRNLSSAEIIDQVIHVKRSMQNPEKITNIVFMGMGEPLANYDNVIRAVHNIVADNGLNFSHRKVTLSTCGLVPKIRAMGRDTSINLAVSLNASDNETRDFLMPINQKYPLHDLLSACRDFPLPHRKMITFEYILIRDVNDQEKDALRLAKLLAGIRAKINLIPLNQTAGVEFAEPSMDRILSFQEILLNKNFTAIIRKSKGQDISAACGQLSGQTL
ncbi:MAG: 23S rRNA (adenine(2503)-C(2))-methyltransferase RlmN [Deltaproteobacteria bacterium]|nr:23S rRNA (adenine(2503)-C(2))-methyltransferase RlmN [Deltaproteobacteria bacterium]